MAAATAESARYLGFDKAHVATVHECVSSLERLAVQGAKNHRIATLYSDG